MSSMVFCRGCGKEIHETASTCPHCGAVQSTALASAAGAVMGFTEAIKTCFSKYATFSGRPTRAEFWWFFLFTFLGGLIPIVGLIFALAVLIPSIAVAVRRLHDTDRSGWWLLIGLIPLVGFIVLLVFYCQESKEPNRF